MFNKKLLILYFLLIAIILVPLSVNAFWGLANKTISAISKNIKVLPDDEIIRLSKLSDEIKGTTKVGKELGKLNLPDNVLEDTFLRIAIYQKIITREAAEGMFSRLSGIPGFRPSLRKLIGNSDIGTAGHLNELKIADIASLSSFKVLGIGEKFIDGIKKSPTDIDILLKKGNKIFAIEAKAYAKISKISMDKYRADLNTLIAYQNNMDDIVPVFTITNKPDNFHYLKTLKLEAGKRDVQLIFGSPQEQIEQIKMLGEIL